MKSNSIKKIVAATMAACMITPLALTTLAGCGGDNGGDSDITKPEVEILSISLDTSAAKTEFKFGENFSYEGLKVTAKMSDNTEKDIPLSDCRVSTPNMETAGKRNVNVTYNGKSARYQITVLERVLPTISETSLLDITQENDSVAYRVEAEAMNLEHLTKPDGVESFVATAPEESETITSGNEYVTAYGVKYNYFGFTFTAAKEFKDVTMVLRLANSNESNMANLGDNMKLYLNRAVVPDEESEEEGATKVVGEIPISASIDAGVCEWRDVVVRNITIPEGKNVLTFDTMSEMVPDIDYIDFYVGMRYISSVVELPGVTEEPKMVDLEDFDTEYASTRKDWADANPDKIVNGLGLEPVTHPEQVENTSRGTSVAALESGSELSTTLRVAQDSTVQIYFKGASISSYIVKDRWEFYIDGIKLIMVENTDIVGGDAGQGAYWDWKNVLLGTYNLPAGDHFFSVKNVGGACNIDGLLFNVITSGSYDENGYDLDKQVSIHDCEDRCPTCNKCLNVVCEEEVCASKCDCPDIVLRRDGTFRLEAENLNMTGNKYQDGKNSFIEECGDLGSNGKCLAGIGVAGNKIVVNFELKGSAKVALSAYMAKYEADFKLLNNAYFTVDDSQEKIYPDTTFGTAPGNDWYNWKKVEVGTFDLEAGKHTLTIHVEKECPNTDYFEFEVSEYDGLIDTTINANGDFVKDAKTLDGSEAVKRPDFGGGMGFVAGADGIYAFTGGTKFRVALKAEADCVVDIFLKLHSDKTETFGQNFKFYIDDVEVEMADPEATMTPNDSWHEEIALRGVQLSAGVHEFRIEVLQTHFDLNSIIFKTTSYNGEARPGEIPEIPENPDVPALPEENTEE